MDEECCVQTLIVSLQRTDHRKALGKATRGYLAHRDVELQAKDGFNIEIQEQIQEKSEVEAALTAFYKKAVFKEVLHHLFAPKRLATTMSFQCITYASGFEYWCISSYMQHGAR